MSQNNDDHAQPKENLEDDDMKVMPFSEYKKKKEERLARERQRISSLQVPPVDIRDGSVGVYVASMDKKPGEDTDSQDMQGKQEKVEEKRRDDGKEQEDIKEKQGDQGKLLQDAEEKPEDARDDQGGLVETRMDVDEMPGDAQGKQSDVEDDQEKMWNIGTAPPPTIVIHDCECDDVEMAETSF